MDLQHVCEVILLFIVTKIDKASLALPCSINIIFKIQIFPGPAIVLVNKIKRHLW